MRLLFILLLSAPLSGCATMWLASEAVDLDWSTSSYTEAHPSNERQQSVAVKTRYVPPPPPAPVEWVPAQPVEEAPPAVEAAPEPAPHGPVVVVEAPPPGTLGLTCDLRERDPKQHVVRHDFQYDGAWKPLMAFWFVSEVALSTVLFMDARRRAQDPGDRNVQIGVSLWLAADAVGTALLFFHPEEERVHEYDAPGEWTSIAQTCPADLSVRANHTEVAVAPDGTIPGQVGRDALLAMARQGARFDLRWRNDEAAVRPLREVRCEWARAQGIQDLAVFCQQTDLLEGPLIGPRYPEPYVLVEQLPPDAPVKSAR